MRAIVSFHTGLELPALSSSVKLNLYMPLPTENDFVIVKKSPSVKFEFV
jgi:hypothetical protein